MFTGHSGHIPYRLTASGFHKGFRVVHIIKDNLAEGGIGQIHKILDLLGRQDFTVEDKNVDDSNELFEAFLIGNVGNRSFN